MSNIRYLRVLAFLVIAIVFATAGCAPAVTEQATQPPEVVGTATSAPQGMEEPTPTEPTEELEGPVALRVGVLEDLDCWNPWTCRAAWSYEKLVYEGLADHGPVPGCPGAPLLADAWEVSNDGLTWTIHLHEGITFSDGMPFTAQTFVDYVNWFNSTSLKYWYGEPLNMETVEVLDDTTLRYTTSVPIINSPDYDWQWWYVMPPHIWSELDDSSLYTYEDFPPIGTGPYVVTEYEPGSYVIFDAREDYYRGKPPIDRVVFQIYTNVDALANALIAGDIDLTDDAMPPESYDALAAAPDVFVLERPPGNNIILYFNMYSGGIKNMAVEDPAVREAIDYAIDKQQIVDVALLGHGITCPTNWSCGPNYAEELNPDLTVTPFDLSKANQILDDAGYVDTDGDGIREASDGQPLEFRLYYNIEYANLVTISDLITNWLKQIGISVNAEAQEIGTWLSMILDQRDYDMAMMSTSTDVDPAVIDFTRSCWAADAGSGALNYSGYCNEEMDALVYEYWYSDDLEGRWEPMWEAQEILNQSRSEITLAGQNLIQAWRSDRFDFVQDACFAIQFDRRALMQAEVK
jgi:peptide/nickel transport system substrate-binding protein